MKKKQNKTCEPDFVRMVCKYCGKPWKSEGTSLPICESPKDKDGLETRAIETCGEALEVVKATKQVIEQYSKTFKDLAEADKVDEMYLMVPKDMIKTASEIKKGYGVEPIQDEGMGFTELMALIEEGHDAVLNHEEVEIYHTKVKSFLRSYGESVRATQKAEIRKMVEGKRVEVRYDNPILEAQCTAYNQAIYDILAELDKLK